MDNLYCKIKIEQLIKAYTCFSITLYNTSSNIIVYLYADFAQSIEDIHVHVDL